ncbi:hypothetical protein AAFF_G00432900 [Aldrovandia affinis]|uniref:Uncharacterized protein n=1 Tax=Aldrovandia affinis TaxID=143900 RepID=A0AAD7S8M9_9TELE|nr:hypothetical protein AAFF_G00432900 [Aldrovandia affinis]
MDGTDPVWSAVPLVSCSQEATSDAAVMERKRDTCAVEENLKLLGLSSLDIGSCDVSAQCKSQLSGLIVPYEDIFSRHHLDCGEAKAFVHRIHLTDHRPFRLPFRRVPPSQYQKLRQVLSEMEQKDIIRKSTSEYTSPLLLCLEEEWRPPHLHRLSLAEQEDPEGCTPSPSPA